jgi:hypothetical protein
VDWDAFTAKWTELAAQNLRLVDVATWAEGDTIKWAGVWREGSDGYALWSSEWDPFVAKWNELSNGGLRLVAISTHVAGGSRRWVGVYREGTDGHYFWAGVDWSSFTAKWSELAAQNLRLVDVEAYVEGDQVKWAGVWREGSDGHYLWSAPDAENFGGKWNELAKAGLRLVLIASLPADCGDDCANHVVSRDKDGNPLGYDYGVTGDPDGPYRWPADDGQYAHVPVLSFDAQPFNLPFKDTDVNRAGTWMYSPPPGNWHHAIDYSRSDSKTFEVVAAAAGKVVFVGWDNWSGNTVIVSHDVGGVTDAFRTIYMHMRNGPTNDIDASWNQTVPTLGDPQLSNYKSYLDGSGAAQDPAKRSPDASFWGTDAEAIPAGLLNSNVGAGQHLGFAGCTGPGGCGCAESGARSSPNTHLHIFFARRDPADNRWYFIDPYGIYSYPDPCYPAGVTGQPSGPCVRYSVAWKDGKPQYP